MAAITAEERARWRQALQCGDELSPGWPIREDMLALLDALDAADAVRATLSNPCLTDECASERCKAVRDYDQHVQSPTAPGDR